MILFHKDIFSNKQKSKKMAEATKKHFKAILIGATGATGKYLLAELIKVKVSWFL